MANGSTLITALRTVRPGDLITASFCNGLVSAILELEDRVSVLETEGRLVVPEDGAEPVRPIVITAAAAKRSETAMSFEVFGSGLQPDGLQTFSLNGQPFKASRLDGDDSRITFVVDQRRFDLAGIVSDVSELMTTRDSATGTASTGRSPLSEVAGGVPMFMTARSRGIDVFGGADISDIIQPEPTRLVLTIEAKSGARASRAVQIR